jgi:hypothetical protein
MPKYSSLTEAIDDNERAVCKVRGCHEPRSRISGFCLRHGQKNHSYGHPLARPIYRKDYAIERDECRAILSRNLEAGHPGVVYAVGLFDRWLEAKDFSQAISTVKRPSAALADHFTRLKASGVTGLDLLVEAASIWLFADRNQKRVDGHRHLTYTLGHKLCRAKAAPLPKPLKGKAMPFKGIITGPASRMVGEMVIKNLGVLLIAVCRKVQAQEAKHQETLLAMYEPLEV